MDKRSDRKKTILSFAGPIAGALLSGFIILKALDNLFGVLAFILLIMFAIWISFKISRSLKYQEKDEFVPDMNSADDLKIIEKSELANLKHYEPDEFFKAFSKRGLLIKSGAMRIFGDWNGEPFGNNMRLMDVDFDRGENILKLNFEYGETLKVWNAKQIIESKYFLRILKADKIVFEYNSDPHNRFYLSYISKGNLIDTSAKTDYQPEFKTDIEMPALIIYSD